MEIKVDRKQIAFVINSRDRLNDLRKLIHWVTNVNQHPVKVIILDNKSTYKPLLDYYDTLPDDIQLVKLQKNYGKKAIRQLVIRSHIPFYVYTDCDIVPKENCPPNVIHHMIGLMKKHPHVHKVGIGIEYEDIPEHNELKPHILLAQQAHWKKKSPAKDAYIADVNTKMAVYRLHYSDVTQVTNNLRTKRPYIARHLTWYLDTNHLPMDFLYYARNASADSSVAKFMDRSGILNMKRKTIKRHTSLTANVSGPPVINLLVGKTYSHITANGGVNGEITFITTKVCKGKGSLIGDIVGQGRRVTVTWRDGNKAVVVLDFRKDLKTYTGISNKDGQVHGSLLESDITKAVHAARKFNNIIPPPVKRKPLVSPAFKNRARQATQQSPIYMVVSGYGIPMPRIRDFLMWNKALFEKYSIRLLVVIDRPINNVTKNFPFAGALVYPAKQKMFSIGKTVNYGIKRVPSPNSVVVKTDIDIIFTEEVINHLRSNVVRGRGSICLCHHISGPKTIPAKINQWQKLKTDPEGRGACFAMVQSDWQALNGYDERIRGWGGDDTEMWMRARKKISLQTTRSVPLFHVKHPPRTVKTYFPLRSAKNMEIANKGDWKNDKWGEAGIFDVERTFVLAISTVNRLTYLKDCIATFNQTRCKYVKWKLIVADDGSTDGTIQYLNTLKLKGVEIVVIRNQKRGIHHQVNTIIQHLDKTHFDVCFKVDDDVFFAKPGWDLLYYTEIKRTGFDHLCLYQPEWRKGTGVKTYNGLVSMIDIENVQGAFYTITKAIIQKVGYLDTANFGLTGLGHVDFTARCCRAGFNRIQAPLDVDGSKELIKLQAGNYKSAIPMAWRHQENTSAVLKKKRKLIKTASRQFIPYTETKMRVGQKK